LTQFCRAAVGDGNSSESVTFQQKCDIFVNPKTSKWFIFGLKTVLCVLKPESERAYRGLSESWQKRHKLNEPTKSYGS
jgi:hypothetical protein